MRRLRKSQEDPIPTTLSSVLCLGCGRGKSHGNGLCILVPSGTARRLPPTVHPTRIPAPGNSTGKALVWFLELQLSFPPGCTSNRELGREAGTWRELHRADHHGVVWGVQHPTAGGGWGTLSPPQPSLKPAANLLSIAGTSSCLQRPGYPGSARPRHLGSREDSRGDLIPRAFSWLICLAPTPPR